LPEKPCRKHARLPVLNRIVDNQMELIKDDYKVKLEVFEGPLDLLLYLIRKEEVDIYDIPIETITAQYMEYLNLMRMLDLNIAGDFIVMAATLMLIKSRMLLPEETRPETEGDEEEDPRWDLVRQLVEYKKFKDAAEHLHQLETEQVNIFTREDTHVDLGQPPEVGLEDVSIFDLISALNEVLDRAAEESLQEIFAEEYTVAQKIFYIEETLRSTKRLCLTDLFVGMKSRQEIVCTFLAVLELINLNRIAAVQDKNFSDIIVIKRDTGEVTVPPPEEEAYETARTGGPEEDSVDNPEG